MHAGVGTAGPDDGYVRVAESPERLLENALYGPDARLPLPSGEVGSVVVQDELHGARRHRGEVIPAGAQVKQSPALLTL